VATRPLVVIKLPGRGSQEAALYKWTGLLNGDDGAYVEGVSLSDKSFQIFGTAGIGLAVVLEGDNSETADQWFTVSKPDGTPLSLTVAPTGSQVLDHPFRLRPRVAGGNGSTDITAMLYVVGR